MRTCVQLWLDRKAASHTYIIIIIIITRNQGTPVHAYILTISFVSLSSSFFSLSLLMSRNLLPPFSLPHLVDSLYQFFLIITLDTAIEIKRTIVVSRPLQTHAAFHSAFDIYIYISSIYVHSGTVMSNLSRHKRDDTTTKGCPYRVSDC